MESVVSVLIDGTQLGTDRQHSWSTMSVALMEYHEEDGWKSSHSWSTMRKLVGSCHTHFTLMQYHEGFSGRNVSTCESHRSIVTRAAPAPL